jgi:pyridinium-3,5-biscarboxylic acid mononucleotide synthase
VERAYEQLRRALGEPGGPRDDIAAAGDYARVDVEREHRKGVPEVVYAPSKTPEQVVAICQRLLERGDRAIVSRTPPATAALLHETLGVSHAIEHRAASGLVVIRRPNTAAPSTGGRVAIITAGTSDLPYADEAAVVAREMGCAVQQVADVGVAGLHRLFEPLRAIFAAGVDVIVVAAGMDGALPSVVSGLSPVPVIGLPTPSPPKP